MFIVDAIYEFLYSFSHFTMRYSTHLLQILSLYGYSIQNLLDLSNLNANQTSYHLHIIHEMIQS
jgi:hypothetical protein